MQARAKAVWEAIAEGTEPEVAIEAALRQERERAARIVEASTCAAEDPECSKGTCRTLRDLAARIRSG